MSEVSIIESLLPSVVTSVITGFMTIAGIAYANWNNRKMSSHAHLKEFNRRKLDKLEELYFIISKYKGYVFKTTLAYVAFHNNKMTKHELLAQLNNNNETRDFDLTHAKVIVYLYFPELSEPYENINNEWNSVFLSWGINSEANQELILGMVSNEEQFTKTSTVFLSELGKLAKNL
ncbi:hypothetical protein AB6E79_20885 [Vibrio lentus]